MSDSQSVAPTTTPITLADAKRHLNVSTTADDTYIADLVNAATQMLEARTNRAFINQTRVLKMDGFDDPRYVHDREIYPPRTPISSVSSLTRITTTGGTSTVPSTEYKVGEHRITEAYNNTWEVGRDEDDSITLTYVCGHGTTQSNIPANVKHAVRMVVGHWYRNREAVLTGTISKEIDLGVDSLLADEAYPNYG